MRGRGVLTKVLAVVGTALVWFPVLATAATSVIGSMVSGVFRLDYLMPAELFLFALAGGGLLLWAAIRTHSRRALIGGGLGGMVGALVLSQAIAVATGLASGAAEPSGWRLLVVAALLALYVLALIEVAVAGVLLVRDTRAAGTPGEGRSKEL
jgi:hypothetical protein